VVQRADHDRRIKLGGCKRQVVNIGGNINEPVQPPVIAGIFQVIVRVIKQNNLLIVLVQIGHTAKSGPRSMIRSPRGSRLLSALCST